MTRAQRLQLQHLICAIDTALAEESSTEGAVTLSKESLVRQLDVLKRILEGSNEKSLGETPLRRALRHILKHHPEVNTVLAVYRFRTDCPPSCPYYLSLNALYQGT
jgi:hypothetical protein